MKHERTQSIQPFGRMSVQNLIADFRGLPRLGHSRPQRPTHISYQLKRLIPHLCQHQSLEQLIEGKWESLIGTDFHHRCQAKKIGVQKMVISRFL